RELRQGSVAEVSQEPADAAGEQRAVAWHDRRQETGGWWFVRGSYHHGFTSGYRGQLFPFRSASFGVKAELSTRVRHSEERSSRGTKRTLVTSIASGPGAAILRWPQAILRGSFLYRAREI